MVKSICSKMSLFFVLIIVIICGCAPSMYEYYKPVATSGNLSSHFGLLAPNDQIEFYYDDVKIRVCGGGKSIALDVSFPKGTSVRFVADNIEWYLNSSGERFETKFYFQTYDWQSWKLIEISPTDILIDKVKNSTEDIAKLNVFNATINLFNVAKDQYFINLPNLEVNNKVYQIPVIKFKKINSFAIIPINS